jgi:hypothetical protein
MMSLVEKAATRIYPYRLKFLFGAIAGFLLFVIVGVILSIDLDMRVWMVVMVIAWWSWLLFVISGTYHPTKGSLTSKSEFASFFPFFREFSVVIYMIMFVAPLLWGIWKFA